MARIEHSIDVNAPARTVYEQLLHFEQYPRFMEGVDEVRRLDDTHLRWIGRSGGRDSQWDALITEQVPQHRIAWRRSEEPRMLTSLQLQTLDDGCTRVTLAIECDGQVPQALSQRTEQDLARFKKFAEGLGQAPEQAGGDWRGSAEHETAGDAHHAADQPDGAVPAGLRHPLADQRIGRDRRRGTQFGARLPHLPRLPELLQGWQDPFGMMRRMSSEMDQLAHRFTGRGLPGAGMLNAAARAPQGGASGWTPAVEVAQHADHLVVCAELPGVRREDVQIEIRSDKLTIEGDRYPQPPQAPHEFRRSERSYGHFYRVISLPEGADREGAQASMQDGVLQVTVPLSSQARQGKRIDIRDGQ
jgi:HSP20 family molecular chaperone IbpA